MAEVCVSCDRVFVFFVVILSLLGSYLAEDIYFYTSDSSSKHREFINLQLIHPTGSHSLQRRDVPPYVPPAPLSVAISNETKNAYLSEKKGKKQVNLVDVKVDTPRQAVKKNLGENGAGILWPNVTKNVPLKVSNNLNLTKDSSSPSAIQVDDSDLQQFENFDDITKYFEKKVEEDDYLVNKSDTHIYYNSSFTTFPEIGKKFWVDFATSSQATTHDLLSMSHRRAATVKLNFDFPFYGHMIRNVTVATGGFIYTGDYVHSWLAATQYIAPLMANFDTSLSNDSFIKFLDNGTSFTVQWENVCLQDRPKEGKFTFQATLHKNGDIVFAYLYVPEIIKGIQDLYHPVTIGLSDAYIIDNAEHFVHRKTIFEYHKVSFAKEDIKNSTVIYLTALPTCQQKKDCQTCLTSEDTPFKCTWCPVTGRCSNGVDRFRHEWLQKNCTRKQIIRDSDCQALYMTSQEEQQNFLAGNEGQPQQALHHMLGLPSSAGSQKSSMSSISILLVALVCISLVMALWIVYAYRNPHTTSGQILIRYRPSQWRWRRGEARYTAATIHM